MTERLEKPIKRRDFLGMAAMGAFFAATGTAIAGMLRLPRPSLFPEPPRRYKIGDPAAFPVGEAKMPQGKNVFVLHDENGFYAVSAVCTHLGCIIKRTPEGFDCPCHGSRFDLNGRNISGPAPRSLHWFALSMAPDGQMVVDEEKTVKTKTYFRV